MKTFNLITAFGFLTGILALSCGDKKDGKFSGSDLSGSSDAKKDIEIIVEVERTSDNGKPGGALSNIEAFENTVYPVLTQYCAGCHAEASPRGPLIASDDPELALSILLDSRKIDLLAPENSRIYIRLKDENHTCWSDCAEDSKLMLDAIVAMLDQGNFAETVDSAQATAPLTMSQISATTVEQSDGQTVVREAESGNFTGKMILSNDAGASGGQFVYSMQDAADPIPNLDHTVNDPDGSVVYTIDLAQAGSYSLWGRIRSPDGMSDSFYIKVNGQYAETGAVPIGRWNTQGGVNADNEFVWTQAPVTLDLPAGPVELTLERRELGNEIDQIALTLDPDFDGTGVVTQSEVRALRYDLKDILPGSTGVFFVVEIRDVSEDAYELYNPRIEGHDKAVKIVAPKLIFNGKNNPNHNGFDNVDMTVAAGSNEILTGSSMIVGKEKVAPEEDSFSFSFESISFE